MKKLLYIFITLSFLLSCTQKDKSNTKDDGVKIKSDYITNLDELKIEKEIDLLGYEIFAPTKIDFDDNYIYILDNKNCSVSKFDSSFNKVLSFGKKGTGPGEVKGCFRFCISKGLAYLADSYTERISVFNCESGNFIRYIDLNDEEIAAFESLDNIDSSNNILAQVISFEKQNNNVLKNFIILVLDQNMKIVNTIFKSGHKVNDRESFGDFGSKNIFTFNDEFIYVSRGGVDSYLVDIFNFDGEKVSEIKRNYKRIEYLESEPRLNKAKFKHAINSLLCYKDNLIINKSMERKNGKDVVLDYFVKNEFIKTFKLEKSNALDMPKFLFIDLYINGDYLYYIDRDNTKLKIYNLNDLK